MPCRSMLFLACIAGTAAAAPAPKPASPLQIVTRVLVEKRVAAADGTTRIEMVTPQKVTPGDAVTFVLAYRNTGTAPLADVVLANPVPAGVAYRGVAPGTPPAELSVDGRSFAALPALRAGVAGGGTRAATPDDIVAVRWRMAAPIAAGASGERAFRGVLR